MGHALLTQYHLGMCFKRRSIFGLLKTFYQGSCTQLVISQPHTHEGVRLFPLQREAVKYKPRCATFPTPQGGVFFFSNATKASSTKHLLQGNLGGQLVRHCSRIVKVVGYNPTRVICLIVVYFGQTKLL